MKIRSMSVIVERRKEKKRVRVVVCEYDRSVVNVYRDEGKKL